jgi:TRAP-type C4-dicarboxylate transport system substrate-binding protein
MKKRRMITLLGGICLILLLTVTHFIAIFEKPTFALQKKDPTPIELKAVTFLPASATEANAFYMLRDRVNERAKGELTIKYLGGPEVIPGREQASAVQKGVVDMAWVTASIYFSIVPGAEMNKCVEINALEERQRGAYDFMVELHRKAGLFYLGRGYPTESAVYYLFLKKQVVRPQELRGLRILATGTVFVNFLKALGATQVTIPAGEEYTALERGEADGSVKLIVGFPAISLQEVHKYWIDYPIFRSPVTNIMNLGSWNRIPKHLQNVIKEAQIETEREWPRRHNEYQAKDLDTILKAGMKPIKFSQTDVDWYFNKAYANEWEVFLKKYPDLAPKYKDLVSKK